MIFRMTVFVSLSELVLDGLSIWVIHWVLHPWSALFYSQLLLLSLFYCSNDLFVLYTIFVFVSTLCKGERV